MTNYCMFCEDAPGGRTMPRPEPEEVVCSYHVEMYDACPGCGSEPGDGIEPGCYHELGCGTNRERDPEA